MARATRPQATPAVSARPCLDSHAAVRKWWRQILMESSSHRPNKTHLVVFYTRAVLEVDPWRTTPPCSSHLTIMRCRLWKTSMGRPSSRTWLETLSMSQMTSDRKATSSKTWITDNYTRLPSVVVPLPVTTTSPDLVVAQCTKILALARHNGSSGMAQVASRHSLPAQITSLRTRGAVFRSLERYRARQMLI